MESRDTFKDLQFDGKPSGYRDFRRKTILAVSGLENWHLQGVQDKGLVSHVALYHKGIRALKEKKVCVRFPSTVPLDGWRLVCITVAGWARRDNGDSQVGYLLLIAESKMLKREQAKCWLVDWSSKKLKRAGRSSVAAERCLVRMFGCSRTFPSTHGRNAPKCQSKTIP